MCQPDMQPTAATLSSPYTGLIKKLERGQLIDGTPAISRLRVSKVLLGFDLHLTQHFRGCYTELQYATRVLNESYSCGTYGAWN